MHDFENRRIIINNKIIELTELENKTLDELIKNKGHITTYEQLCQRLYREPLDYQYRINIQTTIKRLRRKIESKIKIKIRSGYGYVIEWIGR